MPSKKCLDNKHTSYHVYNRGVNKQNIFLDDQDRYFFLKLCRKSIEKFKVKFHAFCLMDNHYHLIIHTEKSNLSKVMKFIGESYAKYFIQRYKDLKKSGHVFSGPYGRRVVDSELYLKTLIDYIHSNPVKDGLSDTCFNYKWSSYKSYYNGIDWFDLVDVKSYQKYFTTEQNKSENYSKKIGGSKIELDLLKKHLKEYKIDSSNFKKLYLYCLLRWSDLSSYELSSELDVNPNTLRSQRYRIEKEIYSENELLYNLIENVRRHFQLS